MTDTVVETGTMMYDVKLFPWWLLLLWGVLAILLGGALLFSPGVTMVLLITFMGAYWLIGGLFALCSLAVDRTNMGWKIFLAIINIIAGILILAYPLYSTFFVLGFFIILVGFWACFVGAAHLFQAFSAKDAGNAALGVLSLIFGILLLINPFMAAALLPFVAGVFAIILGLCSIFLSFGARKAQKPAAA